MIPTMRLTEKGQVTIPKELRDELGLGAGSEIEFKRSGSTLVIRKVTDSESSRGRKIVESLRRRGDVQMTTDEIMKLTRS